MTLAVHRLAGRVLEGNPLGDPVERDLVVYTPPGYDPSRAYPALLALTGFTGAGAMLFNADPLVEPLDRRLDRLIAGGACPPLIVAAPDCFTKVGGSQYLDSTATGRYETYCVEEVVPFVAARHAVSRWGVFGKSSGGYGAIVLALRHPDVFLAFADHSGDAAFELCYLADFPEALDRWREFGGPAHWLEAFWADPSHRRTRHQKALNALAMSAAYSPDPDSPHLGIDFPFDLETGVFRPEVWERWRAWDPVHLARTHGDALRAMRLVYVDCGTKDEFALHWGARALAAAIRTHGVEPIHEEFDDGHRFIPYRYDVSLPLLGKALAD